MVQKKLPLINSAHGSETRNIINELIKLFNQMGYTYDEALQKAQDVLNEAKRVNKENISTQKQVDDLILHAGQSDAEVIQARGGLPLLKDRLDESDTQLAQTVKKGELTFNITDFKCDDGQYVQGDGVHDDTTGIQSAIDYCTSFGKRVRLFFPSGKYKTTDTILITSVIFVDGLDAEIICYHEEIGVDCNPEFRFVEDKSSPLRLYISVTRNVFSEKTSAIGVRIINAAYSYFDFPMIKNHDIGLFVSAKAAKSTSYSTFTIGTILNSATGILLQETEGDDSWVTENTFYGGSFSTDGVTDLTKVREHIRIDGFRISHNNSNKFYNPSFEGRFQKGVHLSDTQGNHFYGVRLEMPDAINAIHMTSNSQSNSVELSYGIHIVFQGKFLDEGAYNTIKGTTASTGKIEYYDGTIFEYMEKSRKSKIKRDGIKRHVTIGHNSSATVSPVDGILTVDLNEAEYFTVTPIPDDITSIVFTGDIDVGEERTLAFLQGPEGVLIEGFPSNFLGKNVSTPTNRAYGRDVYTFKRCFSTLPNQYQVMSHYTN